MTNIGAKNFTSNVSTDSCVFYFEKNFNSKRARKWMEKNFSNGYYFCALYVFLIFSIRFYMRNKPKYELRKALTLWNGGLAIFSILGALRSLPELLHMLTKYSLYHSVCYPTIMEPIEVIEFWDWLFALSKLVELGDTIFVVLRKTPLNFLHWYHHVVTLLYMWYSFADNSSHVRWIRTMNYCVHSIMYSYYALRASSFSLPKFIMMSITSLQIVQMIIGCAIASSAYYYHWTNQPCQVTNWNAALCWLIYISLMVLFSRFFYMMYLSPSKEKYLLIRDSVKIKYK